MSPPLFPHRPQTRASNSAEPSKSFVVPTPIRPVKVDNLDPDIAQENMNIVNGWSMPLYFVISPIY